MFSFSFSPNVTSHNKIDDLKQMKNIDLDLPVDVLDTGLMTVGLFLFLAGGSGAPPTFSLLLSPMAWKWTAISYHKYLIKLNSSKNNVAFFYLHIDLILFYLEC